MSNLNHIPQEFTEGYRGVLFLLRSKDNIPRPGNPKSFHHITKNAQEFYKAVETFMKMQQNGYEGYRIYSSVNARDHKKVIRQFKQRQLDNEYNSPEVGFQFYVDCKNRFFSCFMNPQSAKDKFFLVDCDDTESYEYARRKIPLDHILFQYPTKNGFHFITKPFNPQGFKAEVKKDALMYIG